MSFLAQPFVDARKWEAHERRCALIHFDDVSVMFTASWLEPSAVSARRPDGAFRSEYLVHLAVPSGHATRAFEDAHHIELCLSGARHPLMSSDFAVLHVRDETVTLSVFVDDWN